MYLQISLKSIGGQKNELAVLIEILCFLNIEWINEWLKKREEGKQSDFSVNLTIAFFMRK